ncbi:MAG TPA: exopolysaccharide biosynthesis protein [Aestuariivirgaceae bacterium]|nr:exopolysaccharide biosynthesis protein [Aestuariivirgaceae bacterium]
MTVTATQHLEPPSALLRALASDPRSELRLTDILAYLGDRALAGAMLVFALPILAPLPPGSNFVLGVPLLAITGQLMIGRNTLWLPDMIGRKQMRLETFRSFLHKAADRVEWFEKYMKPRHGIFCTPRADRLVGGACFVLALLLFLPLPFASLLPALALSLFALGLVKRDGVLIAAGWLIVILVLVTTQLVTMALAEHGPGLVSAIFGE